MARPTFNIDKFAQIFRNYTSVCNLRPTSRGSVKIKSSKANDHPIISPNYLSTEDDREVAINSIKLHQKIMNSKALAKFDPIEKLPGQTRSDDELFNAAEPSAQYIQ